MPATPTELFAWHARPGAFERLVPPWQRFEVAGGSTAVEDGSRLELVMRKGPLRFRWLAEHRDVRPGAGFADVQVRGPFALWRHEHLFEPVPGGGSLLRDRIRYRPPGGALGRLLARPMLRQDLERTFRYRHRTTAADLELHAGHRERRRLRVAVSGASGLIGSTLRALLTTGGHQVVRLVRAADRAADAALWSPTRGLAEPALLEGFDAVVHLAGESIAAGRWTARRRRRIRDSRVAGTRSLVDSLARLERPPRVFLCASAIGFYGDRPRVELDETAAGGSGFLADVCAAWEEAALAARRLGARVALARFGVVLSPRGGFLARVLPPFRLGLGGPLGGGHQQVSWISVDDAAAAILHALMSDTLEGPVNVVSPEPLANAELTRILARVIGRPAALRLPVPVVRAAFGELAEETMLSSARVLPGRLLESGFRFRHPCLEPALRHLLGREAR